MSAPKMNGASKTPPPPPEVLVAPPPPPSDVAVLVVAVLVVAVLAVVELAPPALAPASVPAPSVVAEVLVAPVEVPVVSPVVLVPLLLAEVEPVAEALFGLVVVPADVVVPVTSAALESFAPPDSLSAEHAMVNPIAESPLIQCLRPIR
ncbi:MAG TPA: hypothetical protein VFU02_18890 [Polyangiaceae bacterium]|nr:hypothetical protein [Polyangiaceae bacterium]